MAGSLQSRPARKEAVFACERICVVCVSAEMNSQKAAQTGMEPLTRSRTDTPLRPTVCVSLSVICVRVCRSVYGMGMVGAAC